MEVKVQRQELGQVVRSVTYMPCKGVACVCACERVHVCVPVCAYACVHVCCMCAYSCVYMHVYGLVCVHAETRGRRQVCSSGVLHLSF